jgi:hypothetical protein
VEQGEPATIAGNDAQGKQKFNAMRDNLPKVQSVSAAIGFFAHAPMHNID